MNNTLQSTKLLLEFKDGLLWSVHNGVASETFIINETAPVLETNKCTIDFCNYKPSIHTRFPNKLMIKYETKYGCLQVVWCLKGDNHFAEKTLVWTPSEQADLKNVLVSRLKIQRKDLRIVCLRQPSFYRLEKMPVPWHKNLHRPANSEPVKTFCVRSVKGGIFVGLEMPFDMSENSKSVIELKISPSMRVRKNSVIEFEQMYLGVYVSCEYDKRATEWQPQDMSSYPRGFELPLPSESEAITNMVSKMFGPPRFGMMAFACGWHSEMAQAEVSFDMIKGECRSIDFFKECGLDGFTDSHPWGGETDKMNQLTGTERYSIAKAVKMILRHARQKKIIVTQWTTMNNSHPWNKKGQPFRSDKPGWMRKPTGEETNELDKTPSNCIGCRPFYLWLKRVISEAMNSGYYRSWCVDGDFWGTGGYYHTTIPVTCSSLQHDHLPGDATYVYQRTLNELIASIRKSYPRTYIVMCRPAQDMGIWSNRHVDACFTLIETGSGADNIEAGDSIRTASRIRVHHHFFPHWMDWALLFPSYAGYSSYVSDPETRPAWPSQKIDYILLSALSSTPNLLMYLPTKTGIPDTDKKEIKKWLEWGRKNQKLLIVRKDLFDWPSRNHVDGSIHWHNNKGIIFLFNPSSKERKVFIYSRTLESAGVVFPIKCIQEYPVIQTRKRKIEIVKECLEWFVPAQSVIILRLYK